MSRRYRPGLAAAVLLLTAALSCRLRAQGEARFEADLVAIPSQPVARQWTELRFTAFRTAGEKRIPLTHAVVTAAVGTVGGAVRRYRFQPERHSPVFTARVVFPRAGTCSVAVKVTPDAGGPSFQTAFVVRVAAPRLPPAERPAVLVLTAGSQDVTVVDPETLQVAGRVAAAGKPECAFFDRERGRLWIVFPEVDGNASPTAVAYDAITLTEQFRILLPFLPAGIAAAGDRLFLADEKQDRVVWLDRRNVNHETAVSVGPGPRQLLLVPGRQVLCVVDADLADRDPYDSLSVVDVAKGEEVVRLPVGRHPAGLALSADGNTLFVCSPEGNRVTAIDVNSWRVVGVRSAPGNPVSVVAAGQGRSVLALCRRKKAACMVDFAGRGDAALLPLPAAPAQAARGDDTVFVCCPAANLLLAFPVTGKGAVKTIGVSSKPTAVFWRAATTAPAP